MIAIASDHGGFAMKQELTEKLRAMNIEFEDLGCRDTASVDYPLYADALCEGIRAGRYKKGILICGTGLGMSMAANKHPGIRAALCADCYSARMAREHNDANVLCLGGRTLGAELAKTIMEIFLCTEFSGLEKHRRRISMFPDAQN